MHLVELFHIDSRATFERTLRRHLLSADTGGPKALLILRFPLAEDPLRAAPAEAPG